MIQIETCTYTHVDVCLFKGLAKAASLIPSCLSAVHWMLEPKRPKHPRARNPISQKLEPNWPQTS